MYQQENFKNCHWLNYSKTLKDILAMHELVKSDFKIHSDLSCPLVVLFGMKEVHSFGWCDTTFHLLGGIFLSKQIKHLLVSSQENWKLLSF